MPQEAPQRTPMKSRSRSIPWSGHYFRFERLRAGESGPASVWAVSRDREFIGTMTCDGEVTTKEFDVRCQRWLTDLLGDTE
jgi:hypothetical protein